MTPVIKATLRLYGLLFLSGAVFSIWVASMYLPHGNPWQRACEGICAAIMFLAAVQTYRRRKARERQQDKTL
ncbi:hypothetical protein ACFQBQ_13605 [Granulicella cerasi]|uniref:Uncharacterized protein n=1 Tax=Granulicella cerasi TaxID=741063 RepID=A0ABW1ZD26_9BACT|nr:hypothetical protein [Granulicella cerasi]